MSSPDDPYLEEIKQAGDPPAEISNLITDQKWFGLFEDFIYKNMSYDGDICEYAGAINDLVIGKLDPKSVLLNRLAPWNDETKQAENEDDNEALKALILEESKLNLNEIYTSQFLEYVKDIKAGAFDDHESDELKLEDSIDNLINDLTELVGRSKEPLPQLVEKLTPEHFGTSTNELENILEEFSKFAGSGKIDDPKARIEFRKSISLDENDLSNLLNELNSDVPIKQLPSSDELQKMIDQLVNFTENRPDEEILSMLDVDEFQANDEDLEKLLSDLEKYDQASDKNEAIENLRDSLTVNEHDLDKLLNELTSGTVKTNWTEEWDRTLDTLLDELVKDAPRTEERIKLLNDLAPNSIKLSGGKLDEILNDLANLSNQKDDKPLRRRVSREISSEEIDALINEMKAFDFGSNDRPPATKADGWDFDWVAELNYRNIKAAEGGGSIPVVAVASYVLIGDEWNTTGDPTLQMYRNGLGRAYEGDRDYPAGNGLVEIGQVKVEKSPSIFNPGKLEVSGISSANNRRGVEASIKVKSKKKVVFVD